MRGPHVRFCERRGGVILRAYSTRHRRAMNREVVRREAAEHLGEFDHDRASKAGHQSIEETVQRRAGRRGQVRVYGGGGDAGMAEQDLDDARVDTILDQPSRIAVPQDMRCDATLDPRSTGGSSEGK